MHITKEYTVQYSRAQRVLSIDNQFHSVPTDGSKALRDASSPMKALHNFQDSSSNRKCHFEETRLESIRHRQNYKVSDEYFSASLSQEDLFAFWFYLVALKNMK